MLRGIYSAANAMRYRAHEVEITANNIANASTNGFKSDRTALRSFGDILASRVNDKPDTPIASLSKPIPVGVINLGGPVAESPYIDFSQGAPRVTGNPLDLFLQGPGFLSVDTPDGVRYTRNGAFSLNANGDIVNPSGYKLLGVDNQPITLTSQSPITIQANGDIMQDNIPVARINITEFTDLSTMEKEGGNLFKIADASPQTPATAANTAIEQGTIESSNVNPVDSLIQLIVSQRSYEAAARAVDMFNTSMTHVSGELGRIPG
jgi:flagellar basal-body rod protein FlgF